MTDFGLAHADALAPGPEDPPELHQRAAVALTADGALVGTPAYMAPEQFLGQATDARTDQFNFCASLYEALYGRLPFGSDGDDVDAIARRVTAGEVQIPPRGAPVPPWVRDAVLRGLRRKPEERWPSLQALLDALRRDPAVRQRRVLALGAVALLAVAGIAAAGHQLYLDRTRCDREAAASAAALWSPARTALLAGAGSEASASAKRLQGFADSWRAAAQQLCEDDRAQRIPAATAELRRGCLDESAAEASAFVELLKESDPALRHRIQSIIEELGEPEGCNRLDSPRPRFRDRQGPVKVELGRVYADISLGRLDRASATLEALEKEGKASGNLYAQAGALYGRARMLLHKQEHLEEAAADATQCAQLAEAADEDLLGVECRVYAVMILGVFLNRYPEAEAAAREARSAVDRLGSQEWDARLNRVLGNVAVNRGDKQGVALLERALQQMRAFHGREVPSMAWVYNDLGRAVGDLQGDAARAAELFQKAGELYAAAHGFDDPALATFWENAGSAALLADDPKTALAQLDRAKAVAELHAKEMRSDLSDVLVQRAEALLALQRAAEARADLERAELLVQGLDVDSGEACSLHLSRARLELAEGHVDAAREQAEQSVAFAAQRPGEANTLAETRFMLARALGPGPRARELAQQALHQFQADAAPRSKRLAVEVQSWLAANP